MGRFLVTVLRGLRNAALRLSPEGADRLGRFLGFIAFRFIRFRRSTVESQMALALGLAPDGPEIRRLVRANFAHLGMLAVEFFRARQLSRRPLESTVRFEGEGALQKALGHGKGVLILSAHLGNFDLGAMALALRGFPMMIVSKPLKNKAVEQFWMNERSWSGLEISLNRGSLKSILGALRRGRCVVFVLDQHSSTEAVWVDFFGRRASAMPALAVLAQRTGAPVVPVFPHRNPDGTHTVAVGSAIPFEDHENRTVAVWRNTQRYSDAVEAAIRRHPEQWIWGHRRWKKPSQGRPTDLSEIERIDPSPS